MKQDGTRNYPTVAMVANLANPTPEALMTHDSRETLFFQSMPNVNPRFTSLMIQMLSHFSVNLGMLCMGC